MRRILTFIALVVALAAAARFTAADSIQAFHNTTVENSGAVPQEMIYLHLDNTSYYRGERIYFACYLVTSGDLKPSNLSQTVYVELLNPSGKVIDKCVLKSIGGRSHGSLLADETPFYSGYYEIRAYTRYMLNFGEEAIYSRVIPIYKMPQEDGDWAEREMLEYGSPKRTYNRPKPTQGDAVTAKFYPEGGHLVAGLPANVAFELTDASRRPLQATGRVCDSATGDSVAALSTDERGRGVFGITPIQGREYRADFQVGNRTYSVELPVVETQGVTLRVDNLTDPDSLTIAVACSETFPCRVVGASITCRGQLYGRAILDLTDESTATFTYPASKLPTGVCTLTLFDSTGNVLADRLFFNNKHDFVAVDYQFDREKYAQCEEVNLTLRSNPDAKLSVSVTDAAYDEGYESNILADLLLASEIKGYVYNPAWYFEDDEHRMELDRLLMVQGWRKYPWQNMAGLNADVVDVLPEQGIEVHGTVISRHRGKPEGGVSVSAMILDVGKDTIIQRPLYDLFESDAQGRFAFRGYIQGNCVLVLTPSKKDEITSHRIMLDVSDAPESRAYDAGELWADADNVTALNAEPKVSEFQDDLISEEFRGLRKQELREVEVTAYIAPWQNSQIIANSAAMYDLDDNRNAILDTGKKYLGSVVDMLPTIDPNFHFEYPHVIHYGDKLPLFFVDDPPDFSFPPAYPLLGNCDVTRIPVECIKNIYINTDPEIFETMLLRSYGGIKQSLLETLAKKCMSCVVFIEHNPKFPPKMAGGSRRVRLEGYSPRVEFYSPDYSAAMPDEPDYRRTLYWNPTVIPDTDGVVTLRFFNNSTAKKFRVTTSTFPLLSK